MSVCLCGWQDWQTGGEGQTVVDSDVSTCLQQRVTEELKSKVMFCGSVCDCWSEGSLLMNKQRRDGTETTPSLWWVLSSVSVPSAHTVLFTVSSSDVFNDFYISISQIKPHIHSCSPSETDRVTAPSSEQWDMIINYHSADHFLINQSLYEQSNRCSSVSSTDYRHKHQRPITPSIWSHQDLSADRLVLLQDLLTLLAVHLFNARRLHHHRHHHHRHYRQSQEQREQQQPSRPTRRAPSLG